MKKNNRWLLFVLAITTSLGLAMHLMALVPTGENDVIDVGNTGSDSVAINLSDATSSAYGSAAPENPSTNTRQNLNYDSRLDPGIPDGQ